MASASMIKQNAEYTFKYNMSFGRHGWLRLTPAYSVKLVDEILGLYDNSNLTVLDPFSGTGTTGLVAAKHGYNAVLNDINPFLVWFANQKTRNYTSVERKKILEAFKNIIENTDNYIHKSNWQPNIFKIDKWWNSETLNILSGIRASIAEIIGEPCSNSIYSLIWVAFCRIIIETSSASFSHVSMSFKGNPFKYEKEYILDLFSRIMEFIVNSTNDVIAGNISIINTDSKILQGVNNIDLVITSPPYPNRISYIRELRPYMYWLKFIESTTDSSEIDWNCIGGTWGAATSKLFSWKPEININFANLNETVDSIEKTNQKNSKLMSIYVHKYFYDIYTHINKLYSLLNNRADIYYIIGNSTFFNIDVDSDLLYKHIFEIAGFSNIQSKIIRKRNCNKKLYEYCILATKNGGTAHNRSVYAAPATQAWLPFG
jgi:DNA modification methylase